MKSPNSLDSLSILTEMPYKAPKGYHYEVVPFKRNVYAIWLCGGPKYLYLNWETARTIHSFYDMKKKQWFAPVNSKKVGQPVDINSTRPWTAMPLNLNPLENLLYG